MGFQVILQPDRRFAIVDSTSDTIVMWDMEQTEVWLFFIADATERALHHAQNITNGLRRNRKPYHQFTLTWEQALEDDKDHGGEAWKHFKPS